MDDRNIKNYTLSLGVSSLIGTRSEQQDRVYAEVAKDTAFAIICDGMGGMNGGGIASQTAMQIFAQEYEQRDLQMPIPDFLEREIRQMDQAVFDLKDDTGIRMRAGTTAVIVVVEKGMLYWASVGDSRLYVIRAEDMVQKTRDHNYLLHLNRQLDSGKIAQEEYERELVKADALISYLGIGSIRLMEGNKTPFRLQNEDIILLCSDGLYKSLNNKQIKEICDACLPEAQRAAELLTETAVLSSLESQDNTSVVVMQYQE